MSISGRPSKCSPRRGWRRRSTSAAKTRAAAARYGLDRGYPDEREGKTHLDQFLLARRVIEAGARCVTLAFSRWPFGRVLRGDHNWDWHRDLFPEARKALPLLDLGLSALIQDLARARPAGRRRRRRLGRVRPHAADQRRTAAATTGRGCAAPWSPAAACACGQVLGSTTRWGEEPRTRPVHFRDVFATLYQRLGIDVATTQFNDLSGRPQYLVGEHRPVAELIG